MKNVLLITATLFLISCNKEMAEFDPAINQDELLAFNDEGNNKNFGVKVNFDLNGIVQYNPCTGEDIRFTGLVQYQYHITVVNETTEKVNYIYNWKGVRGEGLTTGNRYIGTGHSTDIYTVVHDTVTNTWNTTKENLTSRFILISQGGGNNLTSEAHVKINKGVVEAFYFNFDMCK